MVFAKQLRDRIVRGEITCSIRIWTSLRVTEGRCYRIGDGQIQIDSITPIGLPDITPAGARVGLSWCDRPIEGRKAR